MSSVNIKIDTDAVIAKLKRMEEMKRLEANMQKACALVEASAKQNAPKGDTGELARSITSKVESNGDECQGIVYTPLEYAPYVEYGTGLFAESGGRKDVPWFYKDDEGKWHATSGQPPKPYLRPALQDNRNKIVEIIEEGLIND